MNIIGIDIGGTKCAVILGNEKGEILKKTKFATEDCSSTCQKIIQEVAKLGKSDAIGISCGGPLDSTNGIILSPPNLPDWNRIEIVKMMQERFGVPVFLKNDADACALAEWKFGAGKGCNNMLFLTFGTGLGAGLILGGRLYSGACDMAGEVGHVRLSEFGPVGYGKAGSFEGFCSGSGLKQLGESAALEEAQNGNSVTFAEDQITAKSIADAAKAGDATAIEIYKKCGQKLGQGLAMLIDVLNPERIILGSIFARCEDLLRPEAEKVIARECLPYSRAACSVLPAALGESVGDIATICVALCGINGEL